MHVFFKKTKTKKTNNNAFCMGLELNLLAHHGKLPHGPVTLSSTNATLHIQMEMVAGSPSSYPGNNDVHK